MCLHKFGARDSWLNNWEHWGEDMYCPRALLKIPGSGTTFFFFFALRTALVGSDKVLFEKTIEGQNLENYFQMSRSPK